MGDTYKKMANNILSFVQTKVIYRLEVNFNIIDK